jgi:hypothetical protein
MGGALLQLVAKGKQDAYLIGNPKMTYFKNIYVSHTNFSMESIRVDFNEQPNFGRKFSAFIPKKGDLLNKIVLELNLPQITSATLGPIGWTKGIGHHIIEYIELRIGGELFDRVSGDVIDVYSELTTPIGHVNAYNSMVSRPSGAPTTDTKGPLKMFIPLPFWFCNDISRALPLISLQYSEVQITFKFREFSELWFTTREIGSTQGSPASTLSVSGAHLFCDYIFLDEYERKKFAEAKELEYLIEQFQINDNIEVSDGQTALVSNLHFNHCVKELIWFYQSKHNLDANEIGTYGYYISPDFTNVNKPFEQVELKLNNQDRISKRSIEYFRLVQPYYHHTNGTNDFIYVYSFALNPEQLQPSGTCNFSKIDNVSMVFTLPSTILQGYITVFGINYNIMKIKNGMAGLMFSS